MRQYIVSLIFVLFGTLELFSQQITTAGGGMTPGVVCGEDSRVSATHNAVGRILGYAANGEIVQIGTGFIAPNGKLISARHVYSDGANHSNPAVHWVIEFNVPASSSSGQINHPAAEHIYTIITDPPSKLGTLDYWIFDVELNSVTGEHPLRKQGTSLTLDLNGQMALNSNATIYGYGAKLSSSLNFALQSSSGQVTWIGSSESDVKYEIDTKGGSSGGPVIQNGVVRAIHREGYYSGGQCQNFGTLLNAEGFSLIYNSDWGYKTVYLEQTKYNSSIFSGVLKRWWNNGYLSYTTRKTLSLKENSNIILAADTNLIENFKFKEFENTTIQRVLNENTPPQNTEYKSLLVDVKNSIVINNQFESTAGYNAGQIEFKDPWFAANSSPYLTPPYGYSNLGLNAVFHSRPSPFNPKSSGSDIGSYYKGVFLNQSGSPDWLPPNYSIRASASGSFTVPSSGRTHYFHFLNWISNPSVGAEFQYPENLETAVSFKQDNTTVSALYKGIQLSNNPETYTNNGQQHFVRVKNSYLYSAYESMGKLFIEEKMPNGAWTLMNNGKPIIQEQVFSSSLDFVNNGTNEDDKLLLAYTSQNSGYPVIGTLLLNGYTDAVLLNDFAIWQSDNMHTPSELQPIVAVNGSIKFMIVFRRVDSDKKGLFFFPGTINGSTVSYADSSGYPWYIHGTNQYSVNPTISVSKTAANEPVYWIAWQQNSPSGSSSDIYYKQVTVHSNGSFTQYGGMMSGGSGYPWNRYPTITSIGNSARVAWQGYVGFIEDGMNKTGADEMEESRIIFKSTDWWQYWQFGYNVHKPNINRHDAENGYIFGWSQNGGQGIYFANNTTLSTISTVTGLQGFDVQISNGTDKSTMVANSYKTTQQPYFFTSSNGLSTFMKEQNLRIGSGREGIIRKGDVIFKYLVGDISRNGQEITFKAIPDTINLNSLGIINSYLETEPFTVNSNTELLYSVGFMVSDSVLGAEELNEGDEIKFTLTINDAESGQQVALLDEVTYTKNALGNYGNIAFRATMEGMPETPVKLKLTVQSNFEHISSLARRVNVGDVVEKSSTKTIAVASPLIVTEYSLSQNYPNPFNPVTEIEFALPEQSDVTLKVYDILGKEIATLANGSYSAGRYTVPFDGTSHASGVYIYKLSYGNGQSITRKMTMLK